MATCTGDQYVENIERTECIGNSLVKINNNFKNLDIAVCEFLNNTIITKDSTTIKLTYDSTTRNLSADVIPLTLPTTKVYQMWSVIGTPGGAYLPWGAAFEASNPAYPGGRNAVYNSSLATKLSSEAFEIKRNSFISITDIAYWNWDGPFHSSTTDPIYIWQTYDYSIDGGTTWVQDMSADTGSVKVLLGTSYYGAPVQNGGGSGVGTIYLSAGANTSIKFRPKYRFQKSSTMTGLNVDNMTGYGSHTITIDPIL